MTFKLIGTFLIILTSALTGFSIKYKYNIKISEFKNFLIILDVLNREVCINMLDFKDAIKVATEHADKYNYKIFKIIEENQFGSDGETLSDVWINTFSNPELNIFPYDVADINVLKQFGNLLGSGDVEIQKKNINSFKLLLNEHIEELKNKIKKIELIPKISLYTGVIISIILL